MSGSQAALSQPPDSILHLQLQIPPESSIFLRATNSPVAAATSWMNHSESSLGKSERWCAHLQRDDT